MFFKIVGIALNTIIVLTVYFLNTDLAYAEVNCFSLDTQIAINNSSISIDQLHSDDSVIGYNFDSKKEVLFTVSSITQSSTVGYFLINNDVKVSGISLVYLESVKPKIIKVQLLKKNRSVISKDEHNLKINSIEHIIDPMSCLKITLKEEESNFYANNILFYEDRKISSNFKEENFQDPILCRYGHCTHLNQKTVLAMSTAFLILAIGIFSIAKLIEWANIFNNK